MAELRSAAFCVADITGNRPNVLWEVGYAMALDKPVILITQDADELAFDIKDMETIRYDRNHLSETLGLPLARVCGDTASFLSSAPRASAKASATERDELIGELLTQIGDLKGIVRQAVKAWEAPAVPKPDLPSSQHELKGFEGNWINGSTRTHLYCRSVNGELVAPYCYEGDDELTGVYYGFRTIGQFVFARFCWLSHPISGFSFLRAESADRISGAWWTDNEVSDIPDVPDLRSGVSTDLRRSPRATVPAWAQAFLDTVRRDGVVKCMSRRTAGGRGHMGVEFT